MWGEAERGQPTKGQREWGGRGTRAVRGGGHPCRASTLETGEAGVCRRATLRFELLGYFWPLNLRLLYWVHAGPCWALRKVQGAGAGAGKEPLPTPWTESVKSMHRTA